MEPEILRRGKEFHRVVQDDWLATAEGDVRPERIIPLFAHVPGTKRQRNGRVDIFVDVESDYVVVVEIKSTDWDRIHPKNRRRLMSRHERQVRRYCEKYLDGDDLSVCAGMIYPRPPETPGLRDEIEETLLESGIVVVWYFE